MFFPCFEPADILSSGNGIIFRQWLYREVKCSLSFPLGQNEVADVRLTFVTRPDNTWRCCSWAHTSHHQSLLSPTRLLGSACSEIRLYFIFDDWTLQKHMSLRIILRHCDFYHPPLSQSTPMVGRRRRACVCVSDSEGPIAVFNSQNQMESMSFVMHQFPIDDRSACTSNGMIWSEMTTTIGVEGEREEEKSRKICRIKWSIRCDHA